VAKPLCSVVLNIHDVMSAHYVPVYISTREGCVLKVTPLVAVPGVEFAAYYLLVYHCIKRVVTLQMNRFVALCGMVAVVIGGSSIV